MQLLKGDCLELMKDIPDKSIDMILTDPPYGTTKCKWDSIIPFDEMWLQLHRIIKPKGAIVLFGSEPFSSLLRISNLGSYRYDWIWNKRKAGNIAQANKRPMKIHEVICVFSLNASVYYPQKEKALKLNTRSLGKKSKNREDGAVSLKNEIQYSSGYEPDKILPRSVLEFSKDNYGKNVYHPTQKPVPLLEYLIKTYTNEGDIVLDFTMGSGSTGVACKNTNRDFIGIELDENYYNIAVDRIGKA